MSFPYYQQPDAMDCGPTCLRMVAKHYKRNIPLQTLREKTQIGKEGVNLLGISEAAEAVGLRTQAVKLDYRALTKDAQLPAILHWNQNHFVVLYQVAKSPRSAWSRAGGEVLSVADPAKGLLTYTPEEFRQHWISSKTEGREEGVALLLQPSPLFYNREDEEGKSSEGLQFKNIIQYVLPYKKLVVQLFLGLCIATILQLFLPFLTKSIVDVGVNTANLHFVYIVLLAQLALFAGRLAVEFVRSWILLHISTRINLSILTDFLIKLMKLPVPFFDSKHTGDILQRMNDHSRIESFLTGASLNTLFSLLNLAVFSMVLAIFHSGIFFVFLLASVLYSFWVVLFLKKRKVLDYKRFDVAAREQSAAIQLVQAMQEIKLHGVEKSMRWAWEGLQAKLFRLSVKNLSLNQWQQAGAFFINEGKNIFITFLSAKAVIEGEMTLGAMLAVQYIIGQLNSPIEQLIQFLQSWQNAKISLDRLNEIHALEDEEPEYKQLQQPVLHSSRRERLVAAQTLLRQETIALQGGKATQELITIEDFTAEQPLGLTPNPPPRGEENSYTQPLPGGGSNDSSATSQSEAGALVAPSTGGGRGEASGLGFYNVSFTYAGAGNEPVLHNINLTIPQGQTTAIVGTSGSGKTTLLKLLLKFYEPQKGEIRLGNTALQNISHKAWRSHCGVVMQESFIFSDTIARNIAVGAETIDRNRLYEAVEVANIRDFIDSLPLGFNTKIGPEGTGISMGQKQRILIARAVYRNPEFIFFDEATNSLDANNERAIIENLERFFNGRTVVVVAHRLSTVKNADQIIVLHKGSIAEKGTHQELVSLKGAYYTLVKNQLELGT